MANPGLSDDVCRGTAKLYNDAKGNVWRAADMAGVNRHTFESRVATSRSRFPNLFKDWPLSRGGPPKNAPRTLEQDVEAHRARESEASAKAKLKASIKRNIALEERIKALEWASNVSVSPSDWTLDTRSQKGKSPHIPVLFFSDAQAGEVVRAEEVDTPWAYDSDIFRQRYRKMIATTIDLAMNHGGSRWSFPGAIYLRGGDNISGGLHEDLRELGEDATAVQQSELVYEEEAAGIAKLAEVFGKVEVKSIPGNHDRTTHKPMTKLAWARSFDHLIHKMLTQEFKNDKRVTFQTSKSPDIRFPIFDIKALASHGDKMGSRGGMGFVGPGATILRGWQKLRMEQARLGYAVDTIFTGHLHWPFHAPTLGTANGSFTGVSEFGKQFRMDVIPPLQFLQFYHAKHGCVDVRHLYLA